MRALVCSLYVAGTFLFDGVLAQTYSCPSSPESSPTIIPHNVGSIVVRSTSSDGKLCTLTARNVDGSGTPVPVARSYDGANWEISAGMWSDEIDAPNCSSGECFLGSLPVLGSDRAYVLVSYARPSNRGAREAAARFLEQTTFGPIKTEVAKMVEGGNNFSEWIMDQQTVVPGSSHREYYRKRTGTRFEYPYYGGAPGPWTACEKGSRWRTFAFSKRDGIHGFKTKIIKFFQLQLSGGKYLWKVEGMVRTVTTSLPKLKNNKGEVMEDMKVGRNYKIADGNGWKYDCVGCPVRLCFDGDCGFIENPKVDLSGMESLSKYKIVNLPSFNTGGANPAMKPVDEGAEYTNPNIAPFFQAGDEFVYNSDSHVNLSQCSGHPPVANAGFTESSLIHGRTSDGKMKNVGTAFPPLFGKAMNADTGKTEYLLFDPVHMNYENTDENPLLDGGGRANIESDGTVLCGNVPRDPFNQHGCKLSRDPNTCSNYSIYSQVNGNRWGRNLIPPISGVGTVVCGSRGEVATDTSLPQVDAFDPIRGELKYEIHSQNGVNYQKSSVWANLALEAPDQLRQRVAWALYQIIPIGLPDTGARPVEPWTKYYDIFVRHAFGSYREILREISYTDLMAIWLSFERNKSIQREWDESEKIVLPDENFAREIMQLFSIGVWQLNMDGSEKDAGGQPIHTYTQDNIMSMARAWTGFVRGRLVRGNAESMGNFVRTIDPLKIEPLYRDVFPKNDLFGGFIGDGYPLCADLPERDHLRKGGTYLLLGSQKTPERQGDSATWEHTDRPRLVIKQGSPLYAKLCAPGANGECTFPGEVILEDNLEYETTAAKDSGEYKVDTIRTIGIETSIGDIYYEFLHVPCVEQLLFQNPKKIFTGIVAASNNIYPLNLCADPRRIIAGEMCDTVTDPNRGKRNCRYIAERIRFSTQIERCAEIDAKPAHPNRIVDGNCGSRREYGSKNHWFWTTADCTLRVKIAFESGYIARVDHPSLDHAGERIVPNYVSENTLNLFEVTYLTGTKPTSTTCDNSPSCYTVDDGCVCDVTIEEMAVFTNFNDKAKSDLLSELKVGAYPIDMFDSGMYSPIGNCGVNGVTVYSTNDSPSTCSNMSKEAIFKMIDNFGRERFFKNLISVVHVTSNDNISFRTPVHFISLHEKDKRDMYYETDAVIDHLFYHPTHPPFLTYRMIQKFGISNPSPGFIERVATAYKLGTYREFGSGKYGDLGAMIAAILLDPETRSLSLDEDPAQGHIREPQIKIISFLRSMEGKYDSPKSFQRLRSTRMNDRIGQAAYTAPSVFSFFTPEYSPAGVVSYSGLVAPESQLLTGKRVNLLLDGMWSQVKFGLTSCYNGYGNNHNIGNCPTEENDKEYADGVLAYAPDPNFSVDEFVEELSLMLTAGRLSDTNKSIVKNAIKSMYISGDREKSIRIAQQLMVSTPEFHTTSVPRKGDFPRIVKDYSLPPKHKYKAVVYLYMFGGCDSFNLLVPLSGCDKNMYAEYSKARGGHSIRAENLLPIDATGSGQVCKTFGVNQYLPFLKELYDQGDALFVANAGVLTKPLTKHDNWMRDSQIQLFAHNHMHNENMAVDPLKKKAGSGVGGRLLDMLTAQGYQTASNTVDGDKLLCHSHSYHGNPSWTVSTKGDSYIDKISSMRGTALLDTVKKLNGVSEDDSGLFAETWSAKVAQSLFEYERQLELNDAINSGQFNMNGYGNCGPNHLCTQMKAAAEYMKSREMRKVDREVYYVTHGSYDMHRGDSLEDKFSDVNDALKKFIGEMKRQGIWEDTVIVMGSDFGRSITENSGGGTDHAWGGNYFVLGGGLDGKKIVGKYPEHLSKESDYWVKNGRFIPTTPWESVWNGIAQWMGVRGDDDLDSVLPNRNNFDKCDLFTDRDLFTQGQFPHNTCNLNDSDGDGVVDENDQCPDTPYFAAADSVGCSNPTNAPTRPPTIPTVQPTASPTLPPHVLYEAEDATFDSTGKVSSGNSGYTGSGYANMGGNGSWVEWSAIDGGVNGGFCTLNFLFANGGSKPRPCDVTVNGVSVGIASFSETGAWSDWRYSSVRAICQSGANVVRITAETGEGGPNVDSLKVVTAFGPETPSPTKALGPTKAPIREPTAHPTTEQPTKATTPRPTHEEISGLYEAETFESLSTVRVKNYDGGYDKNQTGTGYLDMGGKGSYFEFTLDGGLSGGSFNIDFRYAVGGSKGARPCDVTVGGVAAGNLAFAETFDWSLWENSELPLVLKPGKNTVRVVAATDSGGPNIDHIVVSSSSSSTSTPTSKPSMIPSNRPSVPPTSSAGTPTRAPSRKPSGGPSSNPSKNPTNGVVNKPPTPSPSTSNKPSVSFAPSTNKNNANDPLPLSWTISEGTKPTLLQNDQDQFVISLQYTASNRDYGVKVFEKDCETESAVPLLAFSDSRSSTLGFIDIDVSLTVDQAAVQASNLWEESVDGSSSSNPSFSFCLSTFLLSGDDTGVVMHKDVIFEVGVSMKDVVGFSIGDITTVASEPGTNNDLDLNYEGEIRSYACDPETMSEITKSEPYGQFDQVHVCVEETVSADYQVGNFESLSLEGFVALNYVVDGAIAPGKEELATTRCEGGVCVASVQLVQQLFGDDDDQVLLVKGSARLEKKESGGRTSDGGNGSFLFSIDVVKEEKPCRYGSGLANVIMHAAHVW